MRARRAARPRADPVRLGLIGLGTIARYHHLPQLARARAARLVAVADPDPDARARVALQTGVEAHADALELLRREDVEAVLVSAPTDQHAPLAVACAQAGKHLYLEKPVAADRAGARRVEQALGGSALRCAIGFNRRLHPLHQHARALVADGRIGEVRTVHCASCEPVTADAMPLWKRRRATGGGVLLDLGSHHVDLLRWILRDEVASVSATCTSELSEQDGAWVDLTFGRGARAHGVFSFRTGYADHLELIGERGTLRVDRHRAALELRLHRRRGYGPRSRPAPTPALAAWRVRRLAGDVEPSYGRALRAFVALVRGGPQRCATLDDGLRSLEVVLAAEDSARRGGATAEPGR